MSTTARAGESPAAYRAAPHAGRTPADAGLTDLLRADDQGLEALTRQGIASAVAARLADAFAVPPSRLAVWIGLSRATLDRKLRARARLGLVESDRVVRYAQLWKQAVHLWGSEDAARAWLDAPEPALGGATPLDHAVTEIGARRVEDLLGQIAHGIAT